jgi:tellurite resistance protein TerC
MYLPPPPQSGKILGYPFQHSTKHRTEWSAERVAEVVETNIWFWVLFNLFVLGMLALDLGVFHRRSHAVSVKEAALWSAVWVSLALLFNYGLYLYAGQKVALEFLGGYLLEESLSVDNIFVFVVIFTFFRVLPAYQHRVLFWGIVTAQVLRGVMILVGTALISRFEFLLSFFGLLLIFTAIKMARGDEPDVDIESNPLVRIARRFVPIAPSYHGDKFFVIEKSVRMATPLLIVLLVVESTDVLFAIDSIPAVFGITQDPFVVYTSNIFAILGLRSLYFMLAGVINKFHYLKFGLGIVLAFVGVKMLVESLSGYVLDHAIHIPIQYSLGFICIVLLTSVVLSLLFAPTHAQAVALEESSSAD